MRGYAVAKQVQRVVRGVEDAPAVRAGQPGLRDVPFFRYRPVEYRCPGGHLAHGEGKRRFEGSFEGSADRCQRLADAVAGDAAHHGSEFGD